MNKYKITLEYDGTNYVGWQRQENGNSIQAAIEKAIEKLTLEKAVVFGAGRTDAGVHAKGQVAHFDIKKNFTIDNIRDGLNQHLRPQPISIIKVEKVTEEFHARFSANYRIYEYLIVNRRSPLTIEKNRAWIVFKKLNLDKMQKESSYFIGKHDFNAFRSINCQSSSSIKTIDSFDTHVQDENIRIKVKAKSFLHSQVRIMVGTLVDIGKGKISSISIKDIINNKDRNKAGVTAPACGLYLIEVGY